MDKVYYLPVSLIVDGDVRPICGIVYAPRRILCDSIAARLNADGIVAAAYHAGLNNKERERVLAAWVDGKRIGIVVATMAFGMGVDRGDVHPPLTMHLTIGSIRDTL
jgi:superfamily II DNA helicase RecQ